MLDWKILAASFASLLVISSVLVGNFGVQDFFSDVVDGIGDLLGGSPFGGFFGTPSSKNKEVEITLFPQSFTLQSDSILNISNSVGIEGFDGVLHLYFTNQSLVMKEKNSPLTLNLRLEHLEIENIKLGKTTVENMAFEVKPNITTNNGTMEMTNFLGRAVVEENKLTLHGNVSLLKITIGDLQFELV